MRSMRVTGFVIGLLAAAATLVGCAGAPLPAPAPVTPGSVADQPIGSGTGCPAGSIEALSAWEDAAIKSSPLATGPGNSASAIQVPVASSVFKPIASALQGACVWHLIQTGSTTFDGKTVTSTELIDNALIQSGAPTTTAQAVLAAAKQAGLRTVPPSGDQLGLFVLPAGSGPCTIWIVTPQHGDASARWLVANRLKTVGSSAWLNITC